MRKLSLIVALASAGLLVACGGSSGGDAPANNGGGNGGNGGPTGITLTGVVAKGAALANASVSAMCAAGASSPVTTGADGSYSLPVADAILPCVIKASGTGADAALVLHSVALGTGTTITANITPVTELLVAQLTGQNPADFMSGTNSSGLTSTITTANLAVAKAEVIETLVAAGLDTTPLTSTDMLSGTLQAGTGTGYDGVLDALGSALASSGTTLPQLTQSVVNTVSATGPGAEAAAPASALPAGLLLRPKAANCDALRSTSYRLVKFAMSNGAQNAPSTAYEDFELDAEALTATFSPTDTMTLTPNGTCRYTLPEGEAVVSPAGVMVIRHMVGLDDDTVAIGDRGASRLMVALPMQDLSVADLVGEYAFIGVDRAPLQTFAGYATVTASGVVNNFRCWDDALSVAEASCTPLDNAYYETLTKNSNGSFTWAASPADPDQWSDTVYAYRAGNGEIMIMSMTDEGELGFAVKRRTLALPAVGHTSANWTMLVDGNLVAAPTTTETTHTVVSVDTDAGTFVRDTTESGTTVQQTIAFNSGRAGYITRAQSTGVRPFEGLLMPGLGLTVISLPNTLSSPSNNARFGLSVRW